MTFDTLGLPGDIHSIDSFLTGPNGSGLSVSPAYADAYPQSDPHRAVKAFLDEHKSLFGFDASILKESSIERDYVNDENEPGSEMDHVVFIKYRTDKVDEEEK